MVNSPRHRHPEEWVGVQLCGKWRIDELIGVGAAATVYAATDFDGFRVAVKMLHPHWAAEPNVRKRFLREGYAVNRVKHPAVISAFDDGITDDGCPFLVLELVEGVNLEDLLVQEGKLEPIRVLEIADELLDALAAAHTYGILHRDLKPDNLLIATDGSLRVLDFGIARMETQQGPEAARLTINGCVMGTPGFMAPEQAKGDWSDVDARTDLWAVGATMFTLLTGRHVHVGRTQQELLVASLTKPAPSLREIDPEMPSRLAAIVDRALAYRPDSRWASAAQMRDEVRKALEQLRGSADQAPPTLRPLTSDSLRAPPPSRPRRSLWPLLAAATVGMVLASGALELQRRLASPPLARDGVSMAARQIAATYAGYHAAARAWPLR